MDRHIDGADPAEPGYAFGDNEAAAARLALLAEVFEEPSRLLLKWVDSRTVNLAVDLGCGPGLSTRLLSALAPEELVGIDVSQAFIDRAMTRGPRRARWLCHDVTSIPLPSGPADLLYARLLLADLPMPEQTALAWLSELRPGGYLLMEEDEFIGTNDATLGAYDELSAALVEHRGGDLFVGRRLRNLEASGEYRWIVNRVYHHHVPVAVAAKLFAMNFAAWRSEPWVVDQRGKPWLNAMEHELARLARSDTKDSVIFAIRQMALQRNR